MRRIVFVICRWPIEFVIYRWLLEFVACTWLLEFIEFVRCRYLFEFIEFVRCRCRIEFVICTWCIVFALCRWLIELVTMDKDTSLSSWERNSPRTQLVRCRWFVMFRSTIEFVTWSGLSGFVEFVRETHRGGSSWRVDGSFSLWCLDYPLSSWHGVTQWIHWVREMQMTRWVRGRHSPRTQHSLGQ